MSFAVRMSGVLAVAVAAATAVACGKVQAKTPGPTPSLTIPEPPSRLVVPVSVDPPAPPPATERTAPATSSRTTATTNRPASTPAATPSPTPSPSPSPTPAPPATDTSVLQSAASLPQLEKNARDALAKATKDLQNIKPTSLSRDARDQYDSANRYITQANDAMTIKNFVYALSCAEKAAALLALIK